MAGKPPALAPPTGVTARLTGPADVTVAWSAVSGARSYRVYRNGLRVAQFFVLRWVDTNLPLGSYGYQVSTVYKRGVESAKSPMTSLVLVAAPSTLVQQRPIQNFDSSSTPSSFYKEFGAHFADGDVPSGKIVEWRKGDGTTVISSQADNFIYWPSGALKDASFTMLYPSALAASGTDTLKGYTKAGSWNNTGHGTTALITALDIRGEITISGVTYTFSANNEVNNRLSTNVRQIRSGPLSAAWKIWGEFRNGTAFNSTAQGNVWGELYLTFFNDGTYHAWLTIQNGKSTSASVGTLSVSDYKLKDYVGPTTLFDYSTSFTMYAGTPVYACDTDGAHPYTGTSVDKTVVAFPTAVLADPTTTGLYDSCATHWYKTTSTMLAAISTGTAATYIPNSVADYGDPNQTGGSPFIGPMAKFASQAMLVGDWASLRADRVNAFANAVNQVGFHDAATGFPANLTSNSYSGLATGTPTVGWGYAPTITISGGNAPPTWSSEPWGGSHAPLYAWMQYLITGQEPWLDMLHQQVIGFLGANHPGTGVNYTRNPTINGNPFEAVFQLYNQTRGQAWNKRNISNAAWVTPTAHPMKPYLETVLANTYSALAEWVVAPNTPAGAATLGVYDGGEDANGCNSGWMHDYDLSTIAMDVRRKYITTSHAFITFHVIPWTLGRAINGCAYAAYGYQIGLGQGATPAFPSIVYPTAWSQVYVGDRSGTGSLHAAITSYAGAGCPGSGLVSDIPNGFYPYGAGQFYPNVGQVAAASAAEAGINTAGTAYNYLVTEEIAAAISEATWATGDNYNWRIRRPA